MAAAKVPAHWVKKVPGRTSHEMSVADYKANRLRPLPLPALPAGSAGLPATPALPSAVSALFRPSNPALIPAAPAEPETGGGGNENFLMKALKVLDKPRAAVVSTVAEVGDWAGGDGFSVKDIGENIGRNYSVGDILKENTTLPGWARAGLGFVGDVVLDPLTYAGGAGLYKQGAQSVTRQLVDPKIVSQLASKGVSKEAAESAAKTVLSKGVARMDPKVAQALGEVTGKSSRVGVYLGASKTTKGVRIPGSERLAQAANDINVGTRKAFISTKAGEKIAQKLGGKAGEAGLIKRMRSGDLSAFHELETMKFMDRTRKVAETAMLTQLDQILKPFKGEGSLVDMRRALEGDTAAASRLAAQGLAENVADVRAWLDQAGARAGLPKIDNYFPRQWSQELRDELQSSLKSGSKDIGPAMKRELVDGTEWMGQVLRGTPAEIRDQIEAIARSVHGNDYVQVFSDKVPDVLAAYAKQIARRESTMAAQDELIRRLGQQAPKVKPVKVPKVGKRVREGYRSPAFSGKAGKVGVAEQGALNFEQAATMAAADKTVEAARKAMRDVDNWVASTAGSRSQWERGLQRQAGVLKRLERQAAKFPDDVGLQGRLAAQRQSVENLQHRLNVLDSFVAEGRSVAEATFDSAAAAAKNARDPQSLAAGIDANATLTLEMFPADAKSVGAIRSIVAKPEQVQTILTGAARQLTDGRNVGEVVDVLSSVGKISGPRGQNALLKWYDKSNAILKQYMIFSPGFHIRNAMGGEFNNFVAGVSHANRKQWHNIWRKSRWGRNPERLTSAEKSLYDQVMSTGTVKQSQAEDVVGTMRSGVSANPLAQNFAPVKGSYAVSGAVEGYLRGSVALDVINKGGSIDDAADAVIKFHYDYDDLSGFERGVMKRIIPFYTWTRKNLPLQLEQMAKQPAKYTAYLKAKSNIEELTPEEGIVPGYFGDLGSIRLPKGVSQLLPGMGDSMAYWSPDLPFRDVAEYVRPDEPLRGLGMAIGAATPIIKLPVERWANKKYFTDQPFFEGHSKSPGSWSAIPGLMPALAALNLAEKGADGSYYMDQRNVYSVEQVVPVLARIHRLAPAGEGDDYMKQRQATNVLSFFGLGVQSNTPEAQASELRKRAKAHQKAVRKARDLGYVD